MNNINYNKSCWVRMGVLSPAFSIIGFGLCTAGWHTALVISLCAVTLVGVAWLCEVTELAPTIRLVSGAILCALPGMMLVSLSIYAGVCRVLVLLLAMGSYTTALVLAKNGAFPRRVWTAGWFSGIFIAEVISFAIASRLWPEAMSLACETLGAIRILLSGNWTI